MNATADALSCKYKRVVVKKNMCYGKICRDYRMHAVKKICTLKKDMMEDQEDNKDAWMLEATKGGTTFATYCPYK